MSQNTSYFMNAQVADGFGTTVAADEKVHREMNAEVDSPALVETQFAGFNVPSAGIHCLNYLWLHPNLGLMSGGAWCWQGFKDRQLEAELFDMRDFVPDGPITDEGGDIDAITLPNGYRHEVVTPLEEVRLTYDDPARGNAFDVTLKAIMPPAMLPSGKHFDQAMRTSGTVSLRGRHHVVDGYTVRDRSWAEARTEDPVGMPAIHWLAMTFGEDFAIHVTGLEDVRTASWRERFTADESMPAAMNRGWVWKDGELRTLASARIRTTWAPRGGQVAHELDLVDADGRAYAVTGTVRALCPWNTWSNVHMSIGLGEWTCEGRTGWGDSQTAMWTDFVRAAFTG
ncbi:MAG: hypothetical protein JWO90_1086 [Solirubrobacterales bacterium]|jgi:hypothetical protein|nr:hypothetical protein [Solirubrobacterales bacterium]